VKRRFAVNLLVFAAIAIAPFAYAHGGEEGEELAPHSWHELWHAWAWEPGTVIPIAISGLLYGFGIGRLWRDAGVGHGIRVWEASCFAGGWLALVIALLSPLHPWGRVLFSAHMTQHEVLMLVAAPLLVLGRPMIPFLHALPSAWSSALARLSNTKVWRAGWLFITGAFIAWVIHAVVLWTWHIPALFDLTNHNEFVHALQHIFFLFSALLFWWAVIHSPARAMGYGMAVLYMFTTAMHSGLLGAMLTFADRLWYPSYAHTTQSWGLTPVEDQELGGLIMWVPAGLVYVFAGLALFVGWLRESERRAVRNGTFSLAEVSS
jgi:cytochrome c oxidase assembly factor CtaG